MKVLVIGGGGREHAIIWKIKWDDPSIDVCCAPGNGGIAKIARCVDIAATDVRAMVEFASGAKFDLVIVAPDDPLALGMVDELERAGIRAFGPNAAAAQIEASKAFAKELMTKYGIPTARYAVFDNERDAIYYLRSQSFPIVVKADGLALGKGVLICQTHEEAQNAVSSMFGGAFGKAGSRVIIEEYISGPEVSVLAFCDGRTVAPMVGAQDHKRVYDGDRGPNTGGMGAFAPTPKYTPEIAAWCERNIFQKTADAMREEGRPFKGVLYFGLMLTCDGPKVLEYNARFGDPETQAVLPLLKTPLISVINAVIDESLESLAIEWENKACVCVVMASGGYPGAYLKGARISGLDCVDSGVCVFHAGTALKNDGFVTSGGRVLGVSALGGDIAGARELAYANVERISFEGAQYRKDIGVK